MATQDQARDPVSQGTKPKKPKSTFMLHDPISLASIAKLSSADPRYCALKVASRMAKLPESCKGEEEGTVKIWLRKTNTKVIREYIGTTLALDTPQKIVRAGREIIYTRRPSVRFVKSWVWDTTGGNSGGNPPATGDGEPGGEETGMATVPSM